MHLPQAFPPAAPILPPEILEKILDELSISSTLQQPHTDIPTLKSWSLVSRAWAPRAQRRIFYRVNLLIFHWEKSFEFLENMARYPERHGHLATYIRCLSIYRKKMVSRGTRSILTPHFPGFLNRLSMLREIGISLVTVGWNDLSALESEALIRAFQSPSLRTINVNIYKGFPISLLSSFGPAVQNLLIGLRSLTSERPTYPHPFVPDVPKLRHLDINTTNVIRSLSHFLTNKTTNDGSFNSLESIRISLRFKNLVAGIAAMKPFFEHCPLLRRFEVVPRGDSYGGQPVIEFQKLDGPVVHIMVWHRHVGSYFESGRSHESIIALFQCLPSSRTLQEIRFENHFPHSVDLISWVKLRSYRSWQALDEYFYRQQLPVLASFTLEIGIPAEWEARVLASCLKSGKHFSKLKSEGVFSGLEIQPFKPYLGW